MCIRDRRNYGYAKLSALIEATELFETRRDGLHLEVRAKPRKAQKAKAEPSAS